MYVCFHGGGGGGAYAFGKIFQPFARKDRLTLWRVKTQMLDNTFKTFKTNFVARYGYFILNN